MDHYALMKPRLLAYERDVRPALSGLDGLEPVLLALRDDGTAGITTTDRALARIASYESVLRAVTPPDDLATVHAALLSVVGLARQACSLHREVLEAPDPAIAHGASAAAAGALLLYTQAHQDLVTHLYPPKAQ